MDLRNRYLKLTDSKEIVAADGRLIRVFTYSESPVWMTCIYDEVRDIAWRTPHLTYESAFNDFVTFCKLLEHKKEPRRKKEEKPRETSKWNNPYLWLPFIGFIAWLIFR